MGPINTECQQYIEVVPISTFCLSRGWTISAETYLVDSKFQHGLFRTSRFAVPKLMGSRVMVGSFACHYSRETGLVDAHECPRRFILG